MSSQEAANRIRCAANLKQIGMAMMLYANENNGNFPPTKYDREAKEVYAYTGVIAKDPFAEDGAPEANDVTAILYLLLRTEDIQPGVFVCPSTDAWPLASGIKALAPPATLPWARTGHPSGSAQKSPKNPPLLQLPRQPQSELQKSETVLQPEGK